MPNISTHTRFITAKERTRFKDTQKVSFQNPQELDAWVVDKISDGTKIAIVWIGWELEVYTMEYIIDV